jgi:hypothetical protein
MLIPTKSHRAPAPTLRVNALLLAVLFWPGQRARARSTADTRCGSVTSTTLRAIRLSTERDKVLLVEQHHFTPEVENLIRGISGPSRRVALRSRDDSEPSPRVARTRQVGRTPALAATLGTKWVIEATSTVPCVFDPTTRSLE